jgi:rubrerythrin
VEDSSLALSSLSVGIKLEYDSVDFYREAKNKSESKAAKDIFDKLIEWETVHLKMLEAQHKVVQSFWWADQGFEPF